MLLTIREIPAVVVAEVVAITHFDSKATAQAAKSPAGGAFVGFWGRRTEIEIPGYWTGPGWCAGRDRQRREINRPINQGQGSNEGAAEIRWWNGVQKALENAPYSHSNAVERYAEED